MDNGGEMREKLEAEIKILCGKISSLEDIYGAKEPKRQVKDFTKRDCEYCVSVYAIVNQLLPLLRIYRESYGERADFSEKERLTDNLALLASKTISSVLERGFKTLKEKDKT